jgi:hypothetical protein
LENASASHQNPAAPDERARWTRTEWAHAALLVLLTIGHWWPRLSGPIDLRFDAGVYYVLGTSLARGDGYRLASEPGDIEAIQYPPLLPAWVALHQRVLGTEDPLVVGRALRITNCAGSLLYALCVYALARRLLTARAALFAGVLAVLYFHTLYLQDLCFTEVPFALLTLLFFLADGAALRLRWLAYPLAASAFLLRTAGIALFAAWVLDALFARRWRAFTARTLLAATCVFAWQGYVYRVTHSPEYGKPAYEYQRAPYQFYNVSYAENLTLLDPFRPEAGPTTTLALARRGFGNAPRLVVGMGESVSAPRGFWQWPLRSLGRWLDAQVPLGLVRIPLWALGLAVVAGVWLLAREGARTMALYVLAALGLIALLPWPTQIPRYLAPLVPFLTMGLARALGAARGRLRLGAAALGASVLLTQAFTLRKTFEVYHHTLEYPRADGSGLTGELFLFDEAPGWRAFYAALGWLRANSAPQDVVASSCPHLVWLHAGRKAVLPPFEPDPAKAQRLLDSARVAYVIVDELAFLDVTRRYAQPVVTAPGERWELVHRDPSGTLAIYRRR